MDEQLEAWKRIDRLAANIGVSAAARKKWRQRGSVPHRWRLPLMSAASVESVNLDIAEFEFDFQRARESEAA